MSSFNAIVLAIFVGLGLLGVFTFATFTTSSRGTIGAVELWGSLPIPVIEQFLSHIRDTREDFSGVTYRYVPEAELIPTLVEAIAAGRGPDLVLFPNSSMVKDGEKLAAISYNTFSRRDFQDTFVEAGEVFLRDDGVVALPLVIDPLVLYWNRTLFGNAGVAAPPKYWDDLTTTAQKITTRSPNGSITTAAVALGSWDNVAHAELILVTLLEQLGTSVVIRSDGAYRAELTSAAEQGAQPALSALRYYTEFADPVKPHYSWNRSLKNSREAFLGGTLAMYLAPASELTALRAANPNLNFDVAPFPLARGAGTGVAARVIGVAIPRGAGNSIGAATVALALVALPESKFLAELTTLPSPRRDVDTGTASDPYLGVFRQSALRSFSYLDPDPEASDAIFSRMIENVASGRSGIPQAIGEAQGSLQALLRVR